MSGIKGERLEGGGIGFGAVFIAQCGEAYLGIAFWRWTLTIGRFK